MAVDDETLTKLARAWLETQEIADALQLRYRRNVELFKPFGLAGNAVRKFAPGKNQAIADLRAVARTIRILAGDPYQPPHKEALAPTGTDTPA